MTTQSTRTSSSRASSAGKKEGRASTVHSANSSPRAPPATPSTRLSVSICRSTRPRLAPSARRTATSRLRALARDRRRPATLAHAISRTSPTAAISVAPIIATSPRNLGSSRVCGRTTIGRGSSGRASVPRLVAGELAARLAATRPADSVPARMLVPRARRPTTSRPRFPRCAGSSRASSGVHSSNAAPRLRPSNRSGATPTIVTDRPSTVTCLPSADDEPPKARCHRL